MKISATLYSYNIRPCLGHGVSHNMRASVRPCLEHSISNVMRASVRPCLEHGISVDLCTSVRPCLGHGVSHIMRASCKTMSGTWHQQFALLYEAYRASFSSYSKLMRYESSYVVLMCRQVSTGDQGMSETSIKLSPEAFGIASLNVLSVACIGT
ncbi:Sun domain-containing 1 [Gossypium arboreum]|uniref:Sun domain-containing 1 n=1 Tax=Gossypium arboreum TaxID=29729 RepID=A0A0B0N6B4_GOSAR|nr:Sun domain-containing 1 [Gossypium arboreum]